MDSPSGAAPVPTALIRPGVELAWAVAKVGSGANPPVAAPGPIRPLLRFVKLPERALATVRQVVEADQEFRARVAEAADEAVLGRAPWLWLVRPEGWEPELLCLAEEAERSAGEAADDRAERRCQRRLALAEAALTQSEAELATARKAAREAEEELGRHRQARRAAEKTAEAHATRLEDAQRILEELGTAAADARSQHERMQEELSRLRSERDSLLRQVSDMEARHSLPSGGPTADEAMRSVVVQALADAADAVGKLGEALEAVAGAIVPGASSGEATAAGAVELTPAEQKSSPARRSPIQLPPAVFDDSPEGAAHLVRTPGVLLLVDGYNASMAAWPGVDIATQRQRLLPALAGLAARTGAAVHVVFDGSDDAPGPVAGEARSNVRVTFSPPDVEADEVIIRLVGSIPPLRPVVVATSDRRVREEVTRVGANAISTPQLLSLLGRHTPRG